MLLIFKKEVDLVSKKTYCDLFLPSCIVISGYFGILRSECLNLAFTTIEFVDLEKDEVLKSCTSINSFNLSASMPTISTSSLHDEHEFRSGVDVAFAYSFAVVGGIAVLCLKLS